MSGSGGGAMSSSDVPGPPDIETNIEEKAATRNRWMQGWRGTGDTNDGGVVFDDE